MVTDKSKVAHPFAASAWIRLVRAASKFGENLKRSEYDLLMYNKNAPVRFV